MNSSKLLLNKQLTKYLFISIFFRFKKFIFKKKNHGLKTYFEEYYKDENSDEKSLKTERSLTKLRGNFLNLYQLTFAK